ncbi:hypothetical protein B0H13DRAFT_2316220 [Mycena leptocephala]|nr:hypothetical protein B0H13DRAFT_2316220 [Mycena leptocephala]
MAAAAHHSQAHPTSYALLSLFAHSIPVIFTVLSITLLSPFKLTQGSFLEYCLTTLSQILIDLPIVRGMTYRVFGANSRPFTCYSLFRCVYFQALAPLQKTIPKTPFFLGSPRALGSALVWASFSGFILADPPSHYDLGFAPHPQIYDCLLGSLKERNRARNKMGARAYTACGLPAARTPRTPPLPRLPSPLSRPRAASALPYGNKLWTASVLKPGRAAWVIGGLT